MSPLARRLIPLFAALLALSLITAACSGDDDPSGTVIEISVQLTSVDRTLREAGPSSERVYGWNRLTGTAQAEGETVTIEMLASVDYVNGSGSFFGFVTITFAGGSTLALRMTDGRTEAATETSGATFTSPLEVLGGTGTHAEASGDGTFAGSRVEALGGAVESTFRLDLRTP